MKIEVQRTGNMKHGRIFDPESNQPLTGANIIIEGSTTGATTNNEGRFSLEFSENENSRVIDSYTGYSSTHINL